MKTHYIICGKFVSDYTRYQVTMTTAQAETNSEAARKAGDFFFRSIVTRPWNDEPNFAETQTNIGSMLEWGEDEFFWVVASVTKLGALRLAERKGLHITLGNGW